MIKIKRIYQEKLSSDGIRILVDRLWPRGISKERAQLDHWMKDVAPSAGLRQWYHRHRNQFAAFKEAYEKELEHDQEKKKALEQLAQLGQAQTVTLLSAAKHVEVSHVPILQAFLQNHFNM